MASRKKIIIYGAGDQGRVVLRILRDMGLWNVVAFVDDGKAGQTVEGIKVLSKSRTFTLKKRARNAIAGIGDNRARAKVFHDLKKAGFKSPAIVHPKAIVSSDVQIGDGTVVCPGVIIWTKARIGANCIINTGAILEHDNVIEDHVHVASGVKCGGKARIKKFALIGTGAVVLPYITVGDNAVVGAGAVVTKNAPDGATVVGVPARILKRAQRRKGTKIYKS